MRHKPHCMTLNRASERENDHFGKCVRLFDRANFSQWIRLEADPSVLFQCERPTRLGIDCDARLG